MTHGNQDLSNQTSDETLFVPSLWVTVLERRCSLSSPLGDWCKEISNGRIVTTPSVDSELLPVAWFPSANKLDNRGQDLTTHLFLLQERLHELHIRRILIDVDHALEPDILPQPDRPGRSRLVIKLQLILEDFEPDLVDLFEIRTIGFVRIDWAEFTV